MKKYKEIQNQNNQQENQIKNENKEAYQNIILYLRGANINIYHQERIRQDLLNLVLEGQARGENIEEVLGEDLQAVADEIILSVPKMTNIEKFLNAISLFLRVTLVLLAIKAGTSLLSWLVIKNGENLVEFGLTDVFMNVFIALLSVFIIYKIVDDSLNESVQFTKKSRFSIFAGAAVIFIFIASFLFLSLKFNPIIFSSSIPIFILGLFILFLTIYALDKYIDIHYHN